MQSKKTNFVVILLLAVIALLIILDASNVFSNTRFQVLIKNINLEYYVTILSVIVTNLFTFSMINKQITIDKNLREKNDKILYEVETVQIEMESRKWDMEQFDIRYDQIFNSSIYRQVISSLGIKEGHSERILVLNKENYDHTKIISYNIACNEIIELMEIDSSNRNFFGNGNYIDSSDFIFFLSSKEINVFLINENFLLYLNNIILETEKEARRDAIILYNAILNFFARLGETNFQDKKESIEMLRDISLYQKKLSESHPRYVSKNMDSFINRIENLERDTFEFIHLGKWYNTEAYIILFDNDSFLDLLDKIKSHRKKCKSEYKKSLEKIKQIRTQRD